MPNNEIKELLETKKERLEYIKKQEESCIADIIDYYEYVNYYGRLEGDTQRYLYDLRLKAEEYREHSTYYDYEIDINSILSDEKAKEVKDRLDAIYSEYMSEHGDNYAEYGYYEVHIPSFYYNRDTEAIGLRKTIRAHNDAKLLINHEKELNQYNEYVEEYQKIADKINKISVAYDDVKKRIEARNLQAHIDEY